MKKKTNRKAEKPKKNPEAEGQRGEEAKKQKRLKEVIDKKKARMTKRQAQKKINRKEKTDRRIKRA